LLVPMRGAMSTSCAASRAAAVLLQCRAPAGGPSASFTGSRSTNQPLASVKCRNSGVPKCAFRRDRFRGFAGMRRVSPDVGGMVIVAIAVRSVAR
jgi:hypothetical protein